MRRFALSIAASMTAATMAMAEGVVAPAEVEFDEYGAVTVSLSGAPGDAENGRLLMNKGSGNCIACHAVTDLEELGFHGEIGPPLDGVADRWTEADLRGIVANAKVMFEGTMMPSFYKTTGYVRPGDAYTGKAAEGELAPLLTAQEVEDVVAYLMTLKES
ncbi:sulfur oxidation c-type cytochrome SoxX [Jannaschia ovalis]|uniref:Sulfur oxidation c-type cytochrome SoxX n=1 Tax=Jannaschia ovalis TaxID=3038773 RepID=A0ABY8LHQ0_9RHOB|nr:sulfur oxidation c-type cytochrome SoxX [Jannaschia sp. GRR-S6-38]WGH79633.1 sulfur oxidation c-type cytochrome SoxX [Jannaschia sp. GRR-S6-38]